MNQSLDDQQVLSANVRLVAEKNLQYPARAILLAQVVFGFDELADHRYFQVAHQVRHEHEAIFQHGHRAAGLAAVIFRDLPGQLANALLYLLRVQQDTLFNHSGFAQAIALR